MSGGAPARWVRESEIPAADVLCLLPVRNAEDDLPWFFESAALFADAVVALDDGSTDRTREILTRHPLVSIILANPERERYEGWDDARNRALLLEAAAAHAPKWIVYLDADESLDACDSIALRRLLLGGEAPEDAALGFEVCRMIGDMEHYDKAGLWVYRAFRYAPSLALPTERFHFEPVPTAIPLERWLRTRLRLRHRAGLTPERRRARYAKYQEVDGAREFQPEYESLLDEPRSVKPWIVYPPETPVFLPAD